MIQGQNLDKVGKNLLDDATIKVNVKAVGLLVSDNIFYVSLYKPMSSM